MYVVTNVTENKVAANNETQFYGIANRLLVNDRGKTEELLTFRSEIQPFIGNPAKSCSS